MKYNLQENNLAMQIVFNIIKSPIIIEKLPFSETEQSDFL